MPAAKPIPDGYHSITPYLVVNGATQVIDFTKQAFGAQEIMRMPGPNGTVAHAELKIGDSIIMIADAGGPYPARPANLLVYVPNVDEVYGRALKSGGTSEREPADQFYGDRTAGVIDAAWNHWWIATHIEDVPPQELERRAAEQSKKAQAK
jgi:PhnB protein